MYGMRLMPAGMSHQQYSHCCLLYTSIGPVAEALGEFEPLDKSTFSAMGLEEFKEKLESAAKKTVVIAGIETHICVEQTEMCIRDRQ